MVSMQNAPIFLAVEIAILAVLLMMTFYRLRHFASWLAPALAIMAGIGLVVFLLYAFPTAVFPAVDQ